MKTGDVQPLWPVVCCLGDTVPVGRLEEKLRRDAPGAARRLWFPAAGADAVFFNLEAAVCRASAPRVDKRYNLRCDPVVLAAFDPRGVAGLANNHVMDFGEAGLAETLEHLAARGIPHTGAGLNLEVARQPAILEIKGSRLAFLAAADPRFSPAGDRSPGTFPARPELLAESIAAARRDADTVVIAIHAGLEFASVPFPSTVRLADLCLDAGARLVVFHHAHCPSGWRLDARGLVLFGAGKHAFSVEDFSAGSRARRRLLLPTRRCAAWRVALPRGDGAPSFDIRPFALADDGLPERLPEPEARAVRAQWERISRSLSRPGRLALRRAATFLRPDFAGLNLDAYRDMIRRQGWRRTWASLREGVRIHAVGTPIPRLLSFLRQAVFWLLPVLILAAIFRRVDLRALGENFARTRPGPALLGLLYYPLVILVGALRWRLLLTQFNRGRVEWGFALKQYWIGLAVGLFGPASVGWDAYRVIAAGRRFGRFAPGAAAIAAEKLLALTACAGLVIGLYPFLPIEASDTARAILRTAYALFAGAVLAFLFLVAARHRLEDWIRGLTDRLLRRARGSEPAGDALLAPLTSWRLLRGTLALSFFNLFVAALGNQLFFRAAGCPLPFVANLFVLPVLMFVFLLPISFGSLGIREGAYILLYGLFGVPAETALLVSFFNLAGLLFNTLIGGILAAMHGTERTPGAQPA